MSKQNINFYSWIAYAVLSFNAITLAQAAPGTLANSPLFTASNIPPNIMLMLDNSGSMSNIVPDTPYDPNTIYIATCPAANLVPPGTSVDIRIENNQPKIHYSGNNALGTESGQRCFKTTATYSARLNANDGNEPDNYLDTDYTGNYLNWYFNANNTTPAWTTQQKKPGTQSRIEIARSSAISLVNSLSNVRLGFSTYNDGDGGSLREIIGDVDDSKKTAVISKINALTASGNTPLAETLSDIGRYLTTGYTGNLTLHPGKSNTATAINTVFNNNNLTNNSSQTIANPIQYSCQKSFAVLMTDGRPQDDRDISTSLRDYTGDCAASPSQCDATSNSTNLPTLPITDTGSTTKCDSSNRNFRACKNGTKTGRTYENDGSDYLDDVAQGLFEMDLRPDLAKTGGAKNNLTTYTIGFADTKVVSDPLLFDTATQGGGLFLTAENSGQLTTAFQNALTDINSKNSSGSAASVSFNTTTLTGASAVYLAQFNKNNDRWSGDLLSFTLDSTNGNVSSTPNWKAADILDARASPVTSRSIITHNGSTGTPFQWTNLTTSQQNDLRTEPNATIGTDTKAQARLNFIRGDRTNEQGRGGSYTFRARSKLLGDIVNSDPVFVGKPRSAWPNTAPFPTASGQNYSDFSAVQLSRLEMIYVGANDGMLHGFKASDGSEAIAYIPGTLFSSSDATSGLHYLTDPAYTHRFYVDMPSTVEDAYFSTGTGAAWHTVLIGGERGGGKGIFALDVTNPASFSEANAAQIALWDFDNSDDADMGYSFSKPTIAMMANGRWAAIFGNGYNNNGDGTAKLFILFLDGGLDGVWTPGTDYIELSTGAGSIVASDCANVSSNCNGLSTPQTADINSDYIVDRVYAGDLKGNMWAFDLSDTVASNWKVTYSGSPLFIAGKPITSKPTLVTHPTQPTGAAPNVLVFFGTGQYLVSSDVTTTDVQAFYGIWDHGVSSITTSSLVQQTFLTNTFTNGGVDVTNKFSVLTNNPVDYSQKQGWFIQLTQNAGERVIVDPDVFGNLLFFNTWIPDSSPCSAGGSGVLMSVKLDTGGRPTSAAFDLTGNNVIDSNDLLNSGGNTYAATGQRFSKGLPSSSNFLADYQYTPGTNGGQTIEKRKVSTPTAPLISNMKRISWQELRN
jgi:type IV pilus assembly protein PilY1